MEKRFLVSRWLGSNTQPIPIYDEASVSTARQRVRDVGQECGASRQLIESVALLASELTHNQLAHARQGYFAVRAIEQAGVIGLEVIAADMGPGLQAILFEPFRQASAANSLRAGLDGVFRIADEVDMDTRGGEGVCVIARKFEHASPPSWEVAIAGRPFPGEPISGDDGAWLHSQEWLHAAVADGLGHGPEAREASHLAMQTFAENAGRSLEELLRTLNAKLIGTRGCALSLVRFNSESRNVECISAGDVHVHLYTGRDAHFFTSTPLIVGDSEFSKRKIRVEHASASPGSVLVMFTDGLHSRTTLKGELDLLRRPAIAIAQQLVQNFSRPNDDAMVLVARLK